jgi:hypothetical protein
MPEKRWKNVRKKTGVASTAPKEQHQIELYSQSRHSSSVSASLKIKFQIEEIKELLGCILISLHWPTVTENDKAILLKYADGLERKLIDLSCEEVH